jgi:hypothetical protein
MRAGDKVRMKQHQAWLNAAKKTIEKGNGPCAMQWVYPFPGKPQEFGFIVKDLGGYAGYLVRPRWKKETIHLYDTEIELAS